MFHLELAIQLNFLRRSPDFLYPLHHLMLQFLVFRKISRRIVSLEVYHQVHRRLIIVKGSLFSGPDRPEEVTEIGVSGLDAAKNTPSLSVTWVTDREE